MKSVSKILQGMCLINDLNKSASDVSDWVVVLELNKNLLFGDAQYINLNKNREEKLRRPQQHLLENDAQISNLKVGYQTGKGNRHLVPVLSPADCIKGLRKIANNKGRDRCGIEETNHYLFPSLNSADHVSGWHAVKRVCQKLQLENEKSITATRNRHRVSTAFALMDVPPAERDYIYKRMGHWEDVNVNVYQAPLAIKAITVVGRRLQKLDLEVSVFS